ncbi:penicillin acylase family protein [Paenarthrobacter ilicis]|uniref:penicillin acylase family protein n=1 Tax=Paenarthrobacter ilicis TaxID=43665 RepID=UPI003AB7747B
MTPAPMQHTAPAGGTGTYRDRWGIPHLWAESANQLAFLQGHNAATDRSWQIEMERWRSEGRTAEVLGQEAVTWDRFARQALLDDTARRCFDNLDAGTQEWCGHYVAGINRALEEGLRNSPEFVASSSLPEPWNPWTPLGVFLVHHILFSTFPNKLFRAHVQRTVGEDAVQLFSIEAPVWSGSNAWAAHGSRTSSGLPLIAGDPHRLMELPGVYQQVRLACPEFDAIGFAFPGVPGLPHFAHTGHTAWAITNAMADYQDLFNEQLRRVQDSAGERVEARGGTGWETVVVSHHTIRVRHGDDVPVEVIKTPRGPVISRTPDGGALSLRFPAAVEGRLGFESLLPLLRSRNVDDVEAALGAWVEPVNSVIAGDSSGSVRHLVAGLVPARNPENRRLPVPAWEPAYSGKPAPSRNQEYVPLASATVNGFAVSANDRASGGGDAIAMEFAPAHRALRIRTLLEAAEGPVGVETMQAIHMDTGLGPWPLFRSLAANTAPGILSPAASALRTELLAWDGRMDAGSQQASAFAAWRGALVQRFAAHPALAGLDRPTGYPSLFGPWLSVASRVGFALETLLQRGQQVGINVQEEVVAALEAAAGTAAPARWGERHQLLPIHDLPVPLASAAPTASLSGDTGCVLCTESLPGVDDRSFRGPVARYVWDLADRANSRWIVPFGAAGTPGDKHFTDQLPLWTTGQLIPVMTDWSRLTKA